MSELIRSNTVLPARREEVSFVTEDGYTLVGELSIPQSGPPVATLIFFHPLPTAGGYMDSHLIRKAANRLPWMADIAVLRFNFRGVSSPRGTSQGSFGDGELERFDLQAAVDFARDRGLPHVWLVGWSFGTEVILKHALSRIDSFEGAVLLAPPLHRTSDAELSAWAGIDTPVVAIVPEHDDFLKPDQAAVRFALHPGATVLAMQGAKHLFVGEKYAAQALSEIVRLVNPSRLPLPTSWDRTD